MLLPTVIIVEPESSRTNTHHAGGLARADCNACSADRLSGFGQRGNAAGHLAGVSKGVERTVMIAYAGDGDGSGEDIAQRIICDPATSRNVRPGRAYRPNLTAGEHSVQLGC